MKERRGKMIVYRCDLCKTVELPKGNQLKLGNRPDVEPKDSIFYDLCKLCEEKIVEQLGKGRKYTL